MKSQDNHENIQENDRERHPDEFYCLSLVETFKNLDPEKKSLPKLKIQQVLHDIQFS